MGLSDNRQFKEVGAVGFDALLGNDRLKQNLTRSLAKGHVSHFYLIVRMKKLKQSGILTFQVDLNCIGKMPGFRIEYTCPVAVPYRKHDTASFIMRNKGSFNQQIYYLLLVIL